MRYRLCAALALALALAPLTAEHVLATTSPSASASFTFPDDDQGDGAVAVVPQTLLVGLLFALTVVAFVVASPSGAAVSEPRRARAPPSR